MSNEPSLPFSVPSTDDVIRTSCAVSICALSAMMITDIKCNFDSLLRVIPSVGHIPIVIMKVLDNCLINTLRAYEKHDCIETRNDMARTYLKVLADAFNNIQEYCKEGPHDDEG